MALRWKSAGFQFLLSFFHQQMEILRSLRNFENDYLLLKLSDGDLRETEFLPYFAYNFDWFIKHLIFAYGKISLGKDNGFDFSFIRGIY